MAEQESEEEEEDDETEEAEEAEEFEEAEETDENNNNNNITETFVLSEPVIDDYDFEVTSDNEGIIDIKSISDELESD